MENHRKEREIFDLIYNGKWDDAINKATHLPPYLDIWQRLPNNSEIPNEHIHKILDILTHPYGRQKDNLNSFLFELASNFPKNVSNDVLHRVGNIAMGKDYYVEDHVLNHPNFKHTDNSASLKRAADFWTSYETNVHPTHFATIKSMFTGKPEKITDHRGQIGSSDGNVHIIPDLKNHSKIVQEKILNDEDIQKRNINNKPHIKLYRGVAGAYAKAIRDKANYSHKTNEVDDKTFIVPTAHLTSWSTDPKLASRFSWRDIDGQPIHQGVVMSKWIPVDSVIHSGFHRTVLGQHHPHSQESELVVGHPDGKIKVSTQHMQFQHPLDDFKTHQEYGSTVLPNIRKSEHEEIDLTNLYKSSAKGALLSAATALSLLGTPYHSEAQLSHPKSANIESKRLNEVQPQEEVFQIGPQAISLSESSGGKNTNHKAPTEGPHKGTHALGQYGLMPMQIMDTIKYDRHLRKKYSNLANLHYQKDFEILKQFHNENPQFEHDIAHSHWKRLHDRFDGDEDRMAYAWLNGVTGTLKTPISDVKNHWYVQKYHKHKQMLKLENNPLLLKSEFDFDVMKFIPLTTNNKYDVKNINDSIEKKRIYSLKNVGHFTHESFVAGLDPENSWLIKLESPLRSGAESSKYGIQSVNEFAFYEIFKSIFGLGQFVPKTILGEVKKNGQMWPASAIKMYENDFVSANALEKQHPNSIKPILSKYLTNGEYHKILAALFILGETDAHGNNLLTDGNTIKIIDHGNAFADESFLKDDSAIFTPYMLRIIGDFNEHNDKLEQFNKSPIIKDEEVKNELKHWLYNLDEQSLLSILNNYKLNSKAVLERLKILQKLSEKIDIDKAINYAWTKLRGQNETN